MRPQPPLSALTLPLPRVPLTSQEELAGWTRARVPREKRSRKGLGLPSRVLSNPGSGVFSQDVSVQVLWFHGRPQSLVLRDAGQAFGGLPGQTLGLATYIHRHEEPTLHPLYASHRDGTTKALFRSVRKPVGGHRGRLRPKNALSATVLISFVIFAWNAQMEGYLVRKLVAPKREWKAPLLGFTPNPSLLGPFTSCVILEVIALVLCLLWRTVAGYQVPGSSESLTIISN